MMFRVFLGLGSNIGDRLRYLSSAVQALNNIAEIVQVSSVYETEPVGINDVSNFFNALVEMRTTLLPLQLLQQVQEIEHTLGRAPETHMKAREIDIDIEIYDNYIFRDNTVEVPHPELNNRKFILAPFAEIAPDCIHPLLRKTILTLYNECPDTHIVTRTNYSLTT